MIHLLLELAESTSITCYRCELHEGTLWCESDCKHAFCSTCWDAVHELGQYRSHKPCPAKDRPVAMPQCHETHDTTLQYWCESCTKPICTNCQQVQHKDHPFILITGFVHAFENEVCFYIVKNLLAFEHI